MRRVNTGLYKNESTNSLYEYNMLLRTCRKFLYRKISYYLLNVLLRWTGNKRQKSIKQWWVNQFDRYCLLNLTKTGRGIVCLTEYNLPLNYSFHQTRLLVLFSMRFFRIPVIPYLIREEVYRKRHFRWNIVYWPMYQCNYTNETGAIILTNLLIEFLHIVLQEYYVM